MSKLNYTQFMDWIKTHPNEKNTDIVELNLSYQNLTSLPKEIGLCTQLQILNCYDNKLTSLPTELGLCTQLIHLDCYNNDLTSLPVELGLCTQLT